MSISDLSPARQGLDDLARRIRAAQRHHAGQKEWHPVEQPPPFNSGGAQQAASPGAALPLARPTWAS